MTIVPLLLALGFPAHPTAAGHPWAAEAFSAAVSLAFTVWLVRLAGRRARGVRPSSAALVLPFIPKHELHHAGHGSHRPRRG